MANLKQCLVFAPLTVHPSFKSWRKCTTPPTKRTTWWRWRRRGYEWGSTLWTRFVTSHCRSPWLFSLKHRVTHLWRLPSQVDSNKDRLVSLQEFLVATNKKEFLEPDSWEVSSRQTCRLKSETFYFTTTAVFDSYLLYLASWSDPGAEPGLHRGGDEGVWGAPCPAGARPQHESRGPPETERRAGETTGTVECTENGAATGTKWDFEYFNCIIFLYYFFFFFFNLKIVDSK